jgi:hypothetical protein
MSRRSFTSSMRMIARAAAQAERARQQAEVRQRAATARQIRDAERRTKADAKEAARLYVASRMEEVDEMNRNLQAREAAIAGLLTQALRQSPAVPVSAVLEPFVAGTFDEAPWQAFAPKRDEIKNPRSKLRGIGGRKEADQKNAASCGEYVPKEIQS